MDQISWIKDWLEQDRFYPEQGSSQQDLITSIQELTHAARSSEKWDQPSSIQEHSLSGDLPSKEDRRGLNPWGPDLYTNSLWGQERSTKRFPLTHTDPLSQSSPWPELLELARSQRRAGTTCLPRALWKSWELLSPGRIRGLDQRGLDQ